MGCFYLMFMRSIFATVIFGALPVLVHGVGSPLEQRLAGVTKVPGCVAFWDFVKREANGEQRFLAHVPEWAGNDFALDAGNYVQSFWGEGRV